MTNLEIEKLEKKYKQEAKIELTRQFEKLLKSVDDADWVKDFLPKYEEFDTRDCIDDSHQLFDGFVGLLDIEDPKDRLKKIKEI